MSEKLQIYKCDHGTMVEVLLDGPCADLTCCGEPMKVLTENTTDAANEKHVPVIEKKDNGYLVKVGEVAHPMVEEHYIMFIELIAGDMVMRKYLKPGEAPEAFFVTDAEDVTAREYCNLHGLWKG